MKTQLSEFIRSKIATVNKSARARKQASEAWRGGTDKEWMLAGCTKTKDERIAIANMEQRILIKNQRELEMYSGVLEVLIAAKK
jgi:hypothetical protein